HELGTNAVKYGALSHDTGRVAIHWETTELNGKPAVRLTWQEVGGPPVQPPQRKGFGSTLIERALSGTQGRAALTFAPDGLLCVIDIAV
ncbi:MAG: PAS domain S-box protein, partial [Alphaproteobacteria bacterium]|nr:PAS domain S-box protein [Alphaproteobacteria bacterium]